VQQGLIEIILGRNCMEYWGIDKNRLRTVGKRKHLRGCTTVHSKANLVLVSGKTKVVQSELRKAYSRPWMSEQPFVSLHYFQSVNADNIWMRIVWGKIDICCIKPQDVLLWLYQEFPVFLNNWATYALSDGLAYRWMRIVYWNFMGILKMLGKQVHILGHIFFKIFVDLCYQLFT
jgi:hypothetical protein